MSGDSLSCPSCGRSVDRDRGEVLQRLYDRVQDGQATYKDPIDTMAVVELERLRDELHNELLGQ